MKATKLKKLKKAGLTVGSVKDFLDLSDEEMELIELKVKLVELLKAKRQSSGMVQQDLAKLMHSSQSRVAKIEAAAPDVSLDLICRVLFKLGVSQREIGRTLDGSRAA